MDTNREMETTSTTSPAAARAPATTTEDATFTMPLDGAIANTIASATTEVEVEKNALACFMGLPPELRVRIYEFLFASSHLGQAKAPNIQATTGAEEDTTTRVGDELTQDEAGHKDRSAQNQNLSAPKTHHRCCVPSEDGKKYHDIHATPLPLVCTCFGPTFPAILRTNKLIYKEAMPVFYGSVEVRACLPDFERQIFPWTVLDRLLEALPASGLRHVSSLLLYQAVCQLELTVDPFDRPGKGHFGPIWEDICRTMPGIRHVRLHLELDVQVYMSCFEFEQFAGVAGLPDVRTVQVDLSYVGSDELLPENVVADGTAEDFEESMVGAIEKKAGKLEKQVDVWVSRAGMLLSDSQSDSEASG